ncbi:acetylxylan esterase 2 [Zalerion maritima]|uniref:Acetylxylan esterase 2 n=1 Tax=Zalerion maritima TaxID=339359 RepID=A0AAD5WNB4_9PEZI|nr:acetylxylan esterase 2 [Zalerion maritima]
MWSTTTLLTAAAAGLATLATAQTTVTSAASSSSSSSSPSSTASCAAGVHLIVARGSAEDPGLGRTGVVAGNVTEAISGSTVEAVEYPATIDDPTYFDSEAEGNAAMGALLKSYVDKCADGKVVLMGYSQGAQVASDLVCGTSEALFDGSDDLSADYSSNIVAVVLFGNPAHLGNASWNAGTSTEDGIFPRTEPSLCDPYADKMRSWCDTGDIYCDSGNDTSVHGTYFDKYTDEATEWVVSMYEAALSSSSSSSSAATGTAASDTGGSGTATGTAGESTTTDGSSEAEDGDDDSAGVALMASSVWGLALALGAGAGVLLVL